MNTPKFILLFLIFVAGFGNLSQVNGQKFEREYGVSYPEVPESAVAFVKGCDFDRKIKWFKEESQDGISFEAKTKFRKTWFSLEFDTLGIVIDVEQKIKPKNMKPSDLEMINKALSGLFSKFKITKIQRQWKGAAPVLTQLIQTGKSKDDFQLAWEVVVRGRQDDQWNAYEVLISPKGEVKTVLKVIRRESDNLEF